MLAGLSPDYYSRLEQGRQANVSEQVLTALSRALRLNDVEQARLRDLGAPTSRRAPAAPTVAQQPDPGLLRLMTTLDPVPVLLLGDRGDILARNALLRAVLGRPLDPGTSFIRYLFQDPTARQRIINWANFAATSVAALRRETGRNPHDRRLTALVQKLRATDPDVARWWDDHAVRDYASVAKRIAHPAAGRLSFNIEIVAAPHDPHQRLVIYTAEPTHQQRASCPSSPAGTPASRSPEADRHLAELVRYGPIPVARDCAVNENPADARLRWASTEFPATSALLPRPHSLRPVAPKGSQ